MISQSLWVRITGMGQWGSSATESLRRLQSRCPLSVSDRLQSKLQSRLKAQLEQDPLQAHSHGCWQDSVLCWQDSVLCWLLDWGPRVLARWLSTSEDKNSQRENVSKTEATLFHTLFMKVTSHHFCHSLFIINKSLGPTHTQGEEIR